MPPTADKSLADRVFLGRYQALRLLGEGGMSQVYLARGIDSEQLVVVKRLISKYLGEPTIRETFRREVEFMRNFRHRYAVQLYEATLTDIEGPCVVMEYVDGPSLDAVLQKKGRLSPERTGVLLGQLCAVLEALHQKGYIHADIKPANIMIVGLDTPEESIKMLDFGLARKRTQATESPYIPLEKITDNTTGTPVYMSPQRIRMEPLDPRDDVYSVGVVLYRMLTGRPPFPYQKTEQLLKAHAQEAPPRFSELEGVKGLDITPAIEAVVQSCLAKQREERPESARALALAYQNALGTPIWDDAAVDAEVAAVNTRPASMMDTEELAVMLEAFMPEQIAVVKLKGFLDDHGAEVTESVPGMIRVFFKRPRGNKPVQKRPALLKWLGLTKDQQPEMDLIEMEVHMEPFDSSQKNHLRISLQVRIAAGERPADFDTWCDQTIRQLSAYLMAKRI